MRIFRAIAALWWLVISVVAYAKRKRNYFINERIVTDRESVERYH
ncbi:MAG: hypothetical protein U9Q79_06020 [Candidatus Hydrogenedentes bacterium]|nr:hypothetical protein [Candidatus Hydrogenedentota bacterium]